MLESMVAWDLSGTFAAVFTCKHCGLTKAARVRVPRRTRARAPAALPPEDPARLTPPEIEAVLERFECPSCGWVERPFRPIFGAKVILLALLVGIAAIVEGGVWIVVGVAALGSAAALLVRAFAAAMVLREGDVQLLEGPIPGRQLAGMACLVCDKRIVRDDGGVPCPECSAILHRDVCAQNHAASAHGPHAGREAYRKGSAD